jgi:hypothetical protein
MSQLPADEAMGQASDPDAGATRANAVVMDRLACQVLTTAGAPPAAAAAAVVTVVALAAPAAWTVPGDAVMVTVSATDADPVWNGPCPVAAVAAIVTVIIR